MADRNKYKVLDNKFYHTDGTLGISSWLKPDDIVYWDGLILEHENYNASVDLVDGSDTGSLVVPRYLERVVEKPVVDESSYEDELEYGPGDKVDIEIDGYPHVIKELTVAEPNNPFGGYYLRYSDRVSLGFSTSSNVVKVVKVHPKPVDLSNAAAILVEDKWGKEFYSRIRPDTLFTSTDSELTDLGIKNAKSIKVLVTLDELGYDD